MSLKFLTPFLILPCLAFGSIDPAKIEAATGAKGTLNEAEGVFKVTVPRSDVKVSVDAWRMPPFMGLTSWASFLEGKKAEAMIMGDLVLFQDEVNPVMSALLESGLNVTALHNHFFFDEPKVYFMHIAGEGSIENLGAGFKAAMATVTEIRAKTPTPDSAFGAGFSLEGASSISKEPLEKIFQGKAATKDGMVKFVFGRSAKMPCGCEAGKEMGINTWAAFAGTDSNAVVDGDFCVLESELQTALKSLRSANVQIVAIHHHMIMEEPRYLFLHYWAKGPSETLATSLKTALDTLKSTTAPAK